jgi:hypothetical protein
VKFNENFGLFQRKLPLDLGTSKFEEMLFSGAIVDGRRGGLIIGKRFSEGGIPIIFQRGREFLVHSFVQHHEFILNRVASVRNLTRLKAINAGLTLNEEVPPQAASPELSHLLITSAEPCDKFLWLNWNQCSVGAEYVDRHMAELNQLNDETNPYGYCDVEVFFPRLDLGTEDGIV